jgi:hypothetical protein
MAWPHPSPSWTLPHKCHMFTTQKNGVKGEKVLQGPSGNALCCPVKAIIRWIKCHLLKKKKINVPIASYYHSSLRIAIKAKEIMDVLRLVMALNFHRIGIPSTEVIDRLLWTGGAMEIFCDRIDMNKMNIISIMGRWHSNAMMHYLHTNRHQSSTSMPP